LKGSRSKQKGEAWHAGLWQASSFGYLPFAFFIPNERGCCNYQKAITAHWLTSGTEGEGAGARNKFGSARAKDVGFLHSYAFFCQL
jgi:hypothetical protein